MTHTEKAKKAFLERVSQIPGVSVHIHGGRTLGEQSMRVIVPDILGTVASQVRMAEIRIRRDFRDVKLNLNIEEAEN